MTIVTKKRTLLSGKKLQTLRLFILKEKRKRTLSVKSVVNVLKKEVTCKGILHETGVRGLAEYLNQL